LIAASNRDLPVLTIAGSDPSGGAGIQGDLKTFAAHRVYGMAVITALTAQNTQEVTGVHAVPPAFVREQLETLYKDIPWTAAKSGMLANEEIVCEICDFYEKLNAPTHLVVDPVMVSSTGARLLTEAAIDLYRTRLLSLTTIATPNHFEAEILAEMPIESIKDQETAARRIHQMGCKYVLVKGGDFQTDQTQVSDLWFDGNHATILTHPRETGESRHGTGCALSASIAALLALGNPVPEAIKRARAYVLRGIQYAPQTGNGNKPIRHDQSGI